MSDALDTAKNYYNSDDADNFYYLVWGGEDIHIGHYEGENTPIFNASRKTVEVMADNLASNVGINSQTKILDIGAGFGGAARYLASRFGCSVIALNLSEKENARDREMNKKQSLSHLIEVVDGRFEEIPFENKTFDAVWSQDAILHSSNREKVLQEVYRVLKPGGIFIFTDPMKSDNCPDDVLKPIYDRISLSSIGSPAFYRDASKKVGFEEVAFHEKTEHLTSHYSRVLDETVRRNEELKNQISEAYLENMKKGLQHWIDGGKNGYLSWGIFIFKK